MQQAHSRRMPTIAAGFRGVFGPEAARRHRVPLSHECFPNLHVPGLNPILANWESLA